jgi:malonate-semialdehyde dehydrogenase (acetylating) / methylmalonate-semialdehyde dehydrogenase
LYIKEFDMKSPMHNFINGEWRLDKQSEALDVINPATQEVMTKVPLSEVGQANQAIEAAQTALSGWRHTPATERIQYLFKLKVLLEERLEEIARLITMECGKTFNESLGEMRRAIENVEVACGIPQMMQGAISEDIAPGIDEIMLRQPVGVCAIIAPFNFPGMIPFWFLPYAIACGNTVVVKPSERVPMTMQRIFEILASLDLPAGVVNLVNGDKTVVDALLDHPYVKAISFVGSTDVARYIYRRAAENGKRAQCQGGAKNPIIVLPDADLEMTTKIVADSAFGCAGQRCLAASLAVTVGDVRQNFTEAITEAATSRVVGYGLDDGVQMGPVITPQSKSRIENMIKQGLKEGSELLVDGRGASISGYEQGNFIAPTILHDVPPGGEIVNTEIFGPVLGMMHANTIEEAIELVNKGSYGNMACLFTSSGSAARKFRSEVDAGNVGINIGVAAPMAFFPFSGWKDSFFGDLHGQSMDAVDFFTQKKVVVERWPKAWTRTF